MLSASQLIPSLITMNPFTNATKLAYLYPVNPSPA